MVYKRLLFPLALMVVCAGCGSGSGTSKAQPPASNMSNVSIDIACTAISGQNASEPFFMGQAVRCRASQGSTKIDVAWETSAGTMTDGSLTKVHTPASVVVTANKDSSRSSKTIQFVAPLGAPGLIFNVEVAGPIWGLTMDSRENVYGAGWVVNSGTVTGTLYSMGFWERAPKSYSLSTQSMFSTGLTVEDTPLFAGSTITPPTETPLILSTDRSPRPVIYGQCAQSGVITALAYNATLRNLWGTWSTNTQALRAKIDPGTLQINCDSAHNVLDGISDILSSPYVLSLQIFSGGTVASGDFASEVGTPTGFIVIMDQSDNTVSQKLFPLLTGIRITPPTIENGRTFFYAAGHQTVSTQDEWSIMKLDETPDEVWTQTWAGNSRGRNEPLAIVLNPAGGIVAAGSSTQLSSSDPAMTDAILLAYGSDGSQPWAALRISPDNQGSNPSTYFASLDVSPDHKFLIAAGGGNQASSRSFILGFALP